MNVARKKTPKVRVNVKASLSRRLREIRQDLFGEHGGPELARRLGLPARTWYNYETGVTVPAEVLLGFIEQTGVNPMWLLSGEGPRYHQAADERLLAELTPVELIRKGLERLERNTSEIAPITPNTLPNDVASDYIALNYYPVTDLAKRSLAGSMAAGHVMAYRKWLPNPESTIGVLLADDVMQPILPEGSIVAVDRSLTDPNELHGKIVAACPDGIPMIRWFEVSGRHVILRPNQLTRDFPLIPIELDDLSPTILLGQVVWAWSRFSQA